MISSTGNKFKLRLIILYFIVIVFFFLMTYYYTKNNYNDLNIEFTNNITKQVSDNIKNSLDIDYNTILNEVKDDNNIDDFILSNGYKVDKYYKIENKMINYNNVDYLIVDKDLSDKSFKSITDILIDYNGDDEHYLVFYYKDYSYIILIDVGVYLNNTINLYEEDINNYIILNQSGAFEYKNKKTLANNLTDYVKRPDDIYIKEELINKNKLGGIKTTVNNEKVYLTISNLVNKQYLLITYSETLINNKTQSFLGMFLISFGGSLLLLLILNHFIIGLLIKRYDDLELTKLTFYYNKAPIIYITNNGKIKRFNKTFKDLFENYSKYEDINDLFLFDQEDLIVKLNKQETLLSDLTVKKDNSNINFVPLKSKGGYALIGIIDTNLFKNKDTFRTLAFYNDITKLPNLNAFYEKTNEIIRSELNVTNNKIFLMINIVDFRNLNRLIGESTADRLIKKISDTVKKESKIYDALIFHTKIDNFILVLENKYSNQDVINWTNKLVQDLNKKMAETLKVSLNLRFSIYNMNAESLSLEAKDIYKILKDTVDYAKNFTTKFLVVYDRTMKNYFKSLKTMQADLIDAIKKDEFVMYVQPQVNNKTNHIVGVETLIRWNNPKYFNQSPEKFIQIAEESNLIVDIGEITMRKSFEIAEVLSKYNVQTSMNISPVQLLQVGFVRTFMDLYNKYRIPKHMFGIEITENVLMSSFNLINEKIRQLKEYGINIHLDDFGTGYSSLKYLDQLNIDTIKIDKGFITNYPTDKFMREIVVLTTNLAKNLGLDIIVEGVETETQNKNLKKIGANIIQGYLISKPIPLNEAVELIKEYNDSNKEGENK